MKKVWLFMAVLALATPSWAAGQISTAAESGGDCGEECSICGGASTYKEGTTYSYSGSYDMACEYVGRGGGCDVCSSASVDESWISADVIADAIESAEVSDLADVVLAYGDRLRLATERNAVAVKGTGCYSESVARLVFVTPSTTAALDELGVQGLERLLQSSPTRVAAARR